MTQTTEPIKPTQVYGIDAMRESVGYNDAIIDVLKLLQDYPEQRILTARVHALWYSKQS